MSRNCFKTGSLVDALLSLNNDASNPNNNNQTIHNELAKAETNESNYYDAYKTMIYFEEAAHEIVLSQFNQINIQLRFFPNNAQFYIKCDEHCAGISEAIDDGILEQFILKPANSKGGRIITGSIQGKNDDKIFIEITDDCRKYAVNNYKHESYDIYFIVNRQPFQLQHYALKMMREQKLFDCLISNPKYDDDSERPALNDSYNFCQTALKMNEEQKIAVANIVKAPNAPLPYLLFGPPGKFLFALEKRARLSVLLKKLYDLLVEMF
ncbi:putative helicase mov-10-B.1 [Contarinia nasturtii]|uniref:putative helicase mov-10-B.1 n=1 Tax=Contarinia nasturtii TaxID=265458 RepID=UPI0012D47032|nr:putative helicase mov-10-B.1 [Contarinia nasturtii]